jgi:methylmalonyl-CoA mutase cobalamin-binding domain/chain
MTHEEILQGLYDHTLVGDAPEVKELVERGLEESMEPESMLYDALIPSLEEVGARFERGDYFVPEMLIAARAMQGALDILRPLLAETGARQVGTFVMGTVKGDVHDIGKNLVNIMLEGAGFEVIDLGVNVAPEKFVEQIVEHKPDIVGFSAFLTTTMPMFKANINALQKSGLRDEVIVMVGGAPVTQEYADAVGADEHAVKGPVFGCSMCGQCVLHSTGLTCPMTCPKQLRNGPCGGVRADGGCEVKPEMRCIWLKAWDRAERLPWTDEFHELRPPVDNRLWGTSSWANWVTKRDRQTPAGWDT